MIKHYYFYVPGWFVQEKLFTQMVLSCNDTDQYHFVEIGSWKGKSSTYMGVEIINSGKKIRFDCVDTWLGSEEHLDKNNDSYEPLLEKPDGLYNEFINNIQPIKSAINPIRMTSVDASKLYEEDSLDFIFIDGAHDYNSVKEDIEHWFPKLKKGGYIAGDDYAWPSVMNAVDGYFGKDNITTIKAAAYNYAEQTWLFQKRG
jgi:predicted O-methyltransferase YrrM